MGIPYDHMDLAGPIMEALHTWGVTRSPDADQTADGPLPAVFLNLMDETPGKAVAVRIVSITQDPGDANPLVRFTLTLKAGPWDLEGLTTMGATIFHHLHKPAEVVYLTATRSLLYSQRALIGPTTFDQNRRPTRMDTYQCRVRVPES